MGESAQIILFLHTDALLAVAVFPSNISCKDATFIKEIVPSAIFFLIFAGVLESIKMAVRNNSLFLQFTFCILTNNTSSFHYFFFGDFHRTREGKG